MGMINLSNKDLTARVKAEAKRLGFDLVGVTGPEPPPHLDVYHQWLARGRYGGMNYLSDERAVIRRSDPLQILPECKSILAVAVNYLPEDHQPVKKTPCIAAYAQGDDYHDVLIDRLEQLAVFIETQVGRSVPHRKYTDTGPLLEREFAQRSGLGWIGKNTCLINPSHGSYLLLAELLLGVQLEPDDPFERDRCGTCTRCIDACPTSCITADRTIDARLCISYLTIEHKDFVPHELREKIGDWLFGCDICQQVCPWNRFSLPTKDPAFQTRAFLKPPDIESFLNLAPDSWVDPLRDSPLLRPRRRGLVRNAAIVAGNHRDPTAIPHLIELLMHDREHLIRGHAAWALGQIGGKNAKIALKEVKQSETDPIILAEIEAALSNL
ncbi:MAG: tRNA epoxyqueuosine(34) reductase QueG [Anaerolineaceae bacterium]|nr:MAG: tRNA epoxyqueuosine(34) reductase QueG [Anaerolineaceae bacterium]